MRPGYSIKRIKDICDKGSSNVAQKDLEGHDGEYPIYGASGFIKNVDFYHQDKEYVGIVKDGSGIGRVLFYPAKSSLIGTLQYIFPKTGYDIRYVGYCLQSLNLSSYRQGAAIPHIYFRDYGEREVLVAESIQEQQRIVDVLDQEFAKIDALKANAEKSLQAAKDLFSQMLSQTFANPSWSRKRIGDVFDTGAGGTPLKTYKEYYENGNVPWLRSGEVCRKYITETEMFITQLGMDNSSAKLFPENTIVVAMYGATAGQVGILHLETTTNQAVCGIFPRTDYIPEFVYYSLLNSKKGLVAQATGNAQPNISQIKIKNTSIPVVSREEQELVVARLDDLNDKCNVLQDNYQKTLSLCDDLKQSLLRKAFNGEL